MHTDLLSLHALACEVGHPESNGCEVGLPSSCCMARKERKSSAHSHLAATLPESTLAAAAGHLPEKPNKHEVHGVCSCLTSTTFFCIYYTLPLTSQPMCTPQSLSGQQPHPALAGHLDHRRQLSKARRTCESAHRKCTRQWPHPSACTWSRGPVGLPGLPQAQGGRRRPRTQARHVLCCR